jgi:alkylhydroperoxidase family enzyme
MRSTEMPRQSVSNFDQHAPYEEAPAHFSDKELVDLTVAVIAINAWNGLAVTFRPTVGNYWPAAATTAAPA